MPEHLLKAQNCLLCLLSQSVKSKGYTALTFNQLMKQGVEKPVEPVPPSPEDLCTIMYTSGTTGEREGG